MFKLTTGLVAAGLLFSAPAFAEAPLKTPPATPAQAVTTTAKDAVDKTKAAATTAKEKAATTVDTAKDKAVAPVDATKAKAVAPVDAAKDKAADKAKQVAPAAVIDINTAPVETLATLRGIGPVRAEAIVKGRPYKGKDDLLRLKVVPENVYNDIKDQIIAKQK